MVSAYLIGYWCRVRDVPFEAAHADRRLGDFLVTAGQQADFRRGWQEAEDELLGERVEQVIGDLKEAGCHLDE